MLTLQFQQHVDGINAYFHVFLILKASNNIIFELDVQILSDLCGLELGINGFWISGTLFAKTEYSL